MPGMLQGPARFIPQYHHQKKTSKFLPNELCQSRDQGALGFNHLKGKDRQTDTVQPEGWNWCQVRRGAGGEFSHHQHLTIFLDLSFPFIAEEVKERREQGLGKGRFLPEKSSQPLKLD